MNEIENNDTQKLRSVVFICGSGRSGSTLLDLLLNNSPQVSSVGEVHRLGRYLSSEDRCTCGEPILECDFWTKSLSELRKHNEQLFKNLNSNDRSIMLSNDEMSIVENKFERLALISLPSNVFRKTTKYLFKSNYARIENSFELFHAIAKAQETPYIIDSTKDARRLKYLYLCQPHLMKYIYLVRDGRAVTLSSMKRDNISMEEAARSWAAKHKKQSLALKSIDSTKIFMCKYEDLCSNPQAVVGQILSFIGISPEQATTLVDKGVYHGLGGNPMRFRKEETNIILDEKWKNELSTQNLRIFENIAGHRNRKLGYS